MEDPAALALAIGGRVRAERQARSWTLDQLAAAAGVSRRLLINIEQGEANPSVGTLLRIGGALGIGLPALVEPPTASRVRVTRSGDGPVLWRGDHGGRAVLVAATQPPDVVEMWDWTLEPGDRHSSDAHSPGTRELVQVLAGSINVLSGNQSVTLEPGDAVAFPGDVPHSYGNPGGTTARFALAVFEPSVVPAPPREHGDGTTRGRP